MEEGGGGCLSTVAVQVPTAVFGGQRHRYAVELRPGETTIVSWKKLVKDSNVNKVNKSAPVPGTIPVAPPLPVPQLPHPALDSRIAPGPTAENDADDVPPASRFSAVIEKIERLYMGKNSSDEEDLNDVPDGDEYDTEDSFIDDAELDEYFQVDNSDIKHDGFFVNHGQLERVSKEPTVSPVQQQKKRKRKDSDKVLGGSDDGHVPNKQMKVSKKTAGKPAHVVGKNSTSSTNSMVTGTAHFGDATNWNQINAPEFFGRKHFADVKISMDEYPLKVLNGEAIAIEKDNKQKKRMDQPKNQGRKLKDGIELPSTSSERANEKGSHAQYKSQPGRSLNSGEELSQPAQCKEKSSIRERADIKVLENAIQTTKTYVMQSNEGSSVKSKGSMLEKAIRELEKIVAESRPSSGEVADTDNSGQSVKRRMPHVIKEKLAKVARLEATNGKISKELLNRLMSILGHLIQLRTLKRQNMQQKDRTRKKLDCPVVLELGQNADFFLSADTKSKLVLLEILNSLRSDVRIVQEIVPHLPKRDFCSKLRNLKLMVNMSLSAKQEKDARFHHIKKEVDEMVKMRIPLMKSKAIEQQAGAIDDFQKTSTKEKEVLKRKFSMDDVLEDKICDLYDLYIDALEEDAGPHLKKLYAELVELWPKGFMDAYGIKCAIRSAKDRKKGLYRRHENQEKMKRKKLPTPKTQEIIQSEASTLAQPQFVQEKLTTDLASKLLVSINNQQNPNAATAKGPNIDRQKQENVKGVLVIPTMQEQK